MSCAGEIAFVVNTQASASALVAIVVVVTRTKFVPSYIRFRTDPADISQSTGSFPEIVLILLAPSPLRLSVQAQVFAVVNLILTLIPAVYAEGAGVRFAV